MTNLDIWQDLGPKRNFEIGVFAENLFNRTNDVSPCFSDGNGCFPFDGPLSGVNNEPYGNLFYQDYTQNPRLIWFYARVRIGTDPYEMP